MARSKNGPETVDVQISEFALHRKRGAKRLVVGFSPANTVNGRFGFFSSLHSINNDSLLLNSPINDWYVDGVPLSNGEISRAETLRMIQSISRDYDETVLLGGSMGGYAALLYGSEVPGSTVVAMGPEIFPGLTRGYFRAQQIRDTPPTLSSLFADRSFQPWIISGEKQATDLFCLSEVSSPRLYTLSNVGHKVPGVVNHLADNMARVCRLATGGALTKILGGHAGQMHMWPELGNLLYLLSIGRVPIHRAERFLTTLPEDFYGKGYLAVLIAKNYERRDNPREALRFAESALSSNPDDLEAHLVHDRLHAQVYGAPPTPAFERFIDDARLRADDYLKNYRGLCRLHGMRPILDWRKRR